MHLKLYIFANFYENKTHVCRAFKKDLQLSRF